MDVAKKITPPSKSSPHYDLYQKESTKYHMIRLLGCVVALITFVILLFAPVYSVTISFGEEDDAYYFEKDYDYSLYGNIKYVFFSDRIALNKKGVDPDNYAVHPLKDDSDLFKADMVGMCIDYYLETEDEMLDEKLISQDDVPANRTAFAVALNAAIDEIEAGNLEAAPSKFAFFHDDEAEKKTMISGSVSLSALSTFGIFNLVINGILFIIAAVYSVIYILKCLCAPHGTLSEREGFLGGVLQVTSLVVFILLQIFFEAFVYTSSNFSINFPWAMTLITIALVIVLKLVILDNIVSARIFTNLYTTIYGTPATTPTTTPTQQP